MFSAFVRDNEGNVVRVTDVEDVSREELLANIEAAKVHLELAQSDLESFDAVVTAGNAADEAAAAPAEPTPPAAEQAPVDNPAVPEAPAAPEAPVAPTEDAPAAPADTPPEPGDGEAKQINIE